MFQIIFPSSFSIDIAIASEKFAIASQSIQLVYESFKTKQIGLWSLSEIKIT